MQNFHQDIKVDREYTVIIYVEKHTQQNTQRRQNEIYMS